MTRDGLNKSPSRLAIEWSDVSSVILSEEVLREKFPIDAGYRIRPGIYHANERFPVYVGRTITVYVIEGDCTYSSAELSVHITSGQFLELSPGWYTFEVDGASVQLVKVFKLPKIFKVEDRLIDGEASI